MSSDDEDDLLKELSKELESIEMSPQVSDDELSVAGMARVAPAASGLAGKRAPSSERSEDRAKRQAHISSQKNLIQADRGGDAMRLGPPSVSCRPSSRTALSPPTSSGQMSPNSVCTATAHGWSLPSATVSPPTSASAPAFPDGATQDRCTMAGPSTSSAHPQTTSESKGACHIISDGQARSARSKRPRVRNRATAQFMAAQPQRPPRQRPTACAALPLAALPPDALHTALRGLSAADLTALPRVCRALRTAASDETLWRRLYYARWGTFSGSEDKILGAAFWKKTYMDRDAEEYAAHVLSQEPALRPAYHSMHLTERAEAVTAANEPAWDVQMCSAPEQAASFMRARGLPRSAPQPADMSQVQLVRFGDVFVDARSGWMHVCDSRCSLQRPDEGGAFLVCPVTGRMHGRVPDVWEGGVCIDGGEGRENEADPPVGGWLANVYEAGYCHNEYEDGEIQTCALLALELRTTR
eukprot:jgi/Ulvmu1/8461/UM043_0041.1